MKEQVVISLLIKNSVLLCGYFIYVYTWVKHKNIAEVLFKVEDKNVAKYITILIGVILVYLFVTFTIPTIQDVPYIIRNDYQEIRGISESNSKNNSNGLSRSVRIRTDEDIIRVSICGKSNNISIGDEIAMKYLPHTHYGYVVEHLSNNSN